MGAEDFAVLGISPANDALEVPESLDIIGTCRNCMKKVNAFLPLEQFQSIDEI